MSTTFTQDIQLIGQREATEQLCDVGKQFYDRGWSVGTSSNYSIVLDKDPMCLLVTASGKDKGRLGCEDFVCVDENGMPIAEHEGRKSSAETLLHVEAAKRTGVGAVLHTHSVWATTLSDLYYIDGGFWIEGYEMLKGLSGISTHENAYWISIFENTQDIPSLATLVRERFESNPDSIQHGYLIRKHGLYTWGKDVAEARRHVEIFEFLFECVYRRLVLSGAVENQ